MPPRPSHSQPHLDQQLLSIWPSEHLPTQQLLDTSRAHHPDGNEIPTSAFQHTDTAYCPFLYSHSQFCRSAWQCSPLNQFQHTHLVVFNGLNKSIDSHEYVVVPFSHFAVSASLSVRAFGAIAHQHFDVLFIPAKCNLIALYLSASKNNNESAHTGSGSQSLAAMASHATVATKDKSNSGTMIDSIRISGGTHDSTRFSCRNIESTCRSRSTPASTPSDNVFWVLLISVLSVINQCLECYC